MDSMEITGKLFKILPEVTGEGKNGTWRKQEFVIETKDEFPKKVCISTWGDKVNINKFGVNDEIKVSINLESREYNNRWYTDVRAWKIETLSKSNQSSDGPPPPGADDLPFDDSSESDDLPF